MNCRGRYGGTETFLVRWAGPFGKLRADASALSPCFLGKARTGTSVGMTFQLIFVRVGRPAASNPARRTGLNVVRVGGF